VGGAHPTTGTVTEGIRREAMSDVGLILIYHRVATPPRDPQLLGVSPSRFAEQLAVMNRRYRPVSLDEMVTAAGDNAVPSGAVAITFDDGYADNLTHAAPLLAKANVPATVYVTTHGDAPALELWWDELERLVLGPHELPRRIKVHLGVESLKWHLDPTGDRVEARSETNGEKNADAKSRSAGEGVDDGTGWNVLLPPTRARERLYVQLHRMLRPMPVRQRWDVLDQLREQVDLAAFARPSHRLMSSEDLRILDRSPLIDIGAHTVTHPVLAERSPEDQRWEMEESRRVLETILDRPVATVSYPYGGRRDYSATTVAIARELGFEYACANHPGGVSGATDRFALPRVLVRDWDGDEFERQIEAAWAHARRTDRHPAGVHG